MNERRSKSARGYALSSPLLLALIGAGIVFFLIMGIKALKKDSSAPGKPSLDSTPAGTQSTTAAPAPGESTGIAPVQSSEAPETASPIITTTAEPVTTEPPGPVMMTVDDSYFNDSLFIGDSRTDGLCLWGTPVGCKHYSQQSMTVFGVMNSDLEAYDYTGLRALLQGMQFGKIYIMLGINECGYDTDYFADTYADVIKEIREYQPEALIYIQSILYVTQEHENNYPVFATENIKEKNEAIKKLANNVDIFYLEVNDCMNDGTDHLPESYTDDGAHLKASYYYLWHDYLLEHAMVDAKHPWTPSGSAPEGAQAEHP